MIFFCHVNDGHFDISVQTNPVYPCSLFIDNSLVTSGYYGEINQWDFNRPKPQVKSILHHCGSAVHRVTFHSNEPNLLMLGGQDGSVVIFDLRKREPNQSFW